MTQEKRAYKAAYYTLGCKLNFAESSTICKRLQKLGFTTTSPEETPDICVVNTCSVTDVADKKGRSLIRRLHRQWPETAIIVTGCYAQLKPAEVASLPGVELVIGNNDKLRLDSYIEQWLATRRKVVDVVRTRDMTRFAYSCERGDRTRWMLKVQDGCDYWCTYCTIPMARGRSRSGSISSLVALAHDVADTGGREIVLTGVNVGDFGKGTEHDFFDLIRALDEVEGIERYRISSIEPNLLSPKIIEWVATTSKAFMPHFHIPLQSGSDAVLKLMHRHYDTALFAERVNLIRSFMPHAFIGVDIMAGSRGETLTEWEASLEFIRSLDVQQLHVFPYSERPGTRALLLNVAIVDRAERHRRVAVLMEESQRKYEAFRKDAVGSVRNVLWEQPRSNSAVMHGFTDNYLRVQAPYNEHLIGLVTPVCIGAPIDTENMSAHIINPSNES